MHEYQGTHEHPIEEKHCRHYHFTKSLRVQNKSCSIYFSYFGQFQALLVFSSQRWRLYPDKYWDGLPAKSQAVQWITLFDSKKVQFKLLWMAFDYKTTALTKVAGVLQMVSYQWPVLLALKDMRLVPLIHWKLLEHFTATEWWKGEEKST